MNEKKRFVNPMAEIVNLINEDIITSSGNEFASDDWGTNDSPEYWGNN